MNLRAGALLLALAMGGCTTVPSSAPAPRAPAPTPAPPPATASPADLLAAVQRLSDQIDAEKDAAARARLVGRALYAAERCLGEAPQDGACHYARGIVFGLAARENPLKAGAILKDMLASLAQAEALSPAIDHAGPARLQAIVLLRAPSWPLGPGDADSALAAAKRAVAIEPGWPANAAILKEAQAKVADQ